MALDVVVVGSDRVEKTFNREVLKYCPEIDNTLHERQVAAHPDGGAGEGPPPVPRVAVDMSQALFSKLYVYCHFLKVVTPELRDSVCNPGGRSCGHGGMAVRGVLKWEREYIGADVDAICELMVGAYELGMMNLVDLCNVTLLELVGVPDTDECRSMFLLEDPDDIVASDEEEQVFHENEWVVG